MEKMEGVRVLDEGSNLDQKSTTIFEKRENPSDPETHQPPEFQASDATAALATQEPSGTARKRTSEPRSLASFLSSSSLAASPAAPASRREATPSPPPVLSSEAAPVLSKLQCETRVVLRRLSLTEVPSASNNSPEPPQEGPKSVSTRISPRRFHPYVRLHTLSSSMGRAILSGQRRMEQQFLKTLGKLPDLQVKLRAIQGHLHGLRKQQKSLRVALNRWNRCDMVLEFEGLQRQMGTIISHQQVLLTSMLQILGALGFCPERLCSPATVH
ncbi:uncharacterized protein LOC128351948 isoform X2 [Hemicordylus capensis]|uniref:uncharacterized protein LOC128351948 isoform X2 n=1 Tax=Hemicordylus capensis TaxID=884348 RepID=UPI0023028313|nr:uncharacterized protein LOC128351948 isoform X2 [Hemicordylus capensis]